MVQGFGAILTEKQQQKKSQKPPLQEMNEVQNKLSNYFEEIEDPRANKNKKHLLGDILIIAILAVIAGGEGWEDMENYGIAKEQWLKEFLVLENGIPSDDTFRRLFERIEPSGLGKALSQWVQAMMGSIEGEVIPIDGKTLRGSYDRNKGVKALHLLTAWASEQRLVLGQVKVEDHTNEITAIPALLELLDLTGAIVTIDAMGTQTEIVKQIREKRADYILSLKANHPTLYSQVDNWFKQARANHFEGIELSYDYRIEKGHHRTEKRKVWAVPVETFGGLYRQEQWLALKTIVIVERVRHLWNKTTVEVQFYLSSLPPDAQRQGRAIRQHWGIENQLHWTLDVTWGEDHCRVRSGNSPHNLALLRRMAINALNQETTLKRSLKQKRKRAGMNNDYMLTVLNSFCQA